MRIFLLKKKHALVSLLRDFISAEVRTQYVVEKHHDWAVAGNGDTLPHVEAGEIPLIVSLTTYSHRINDVYLVVESILRQSVLPNRIILWLDEDEFADDTLPVLLKKQRRRGLEIMYYKNIRSYKKIIPTLELTKECNIITVDDDLIYPYDFIERFLRAYKKNPKCVYYYCGRRILHEGSRFRAYNKWPMVDSTTEQFDVLPTGAGGVFYPAGCFDDRVTDESLFMELCPHADDVWLRVMTMLKGYKCRKIEFSGSFNNYFAHIWRGQDIALSNRNYFNNANDTQVCAAFGRFEIYK